MTKMTYVDALNYAIANLTDETVVEKLTALRDQQVKRNSADRKPTKAQRENEDMKSTILDYLATVDKVRATEVATAVNVSGQKASALLNQLVVTGLVEKVIDKRVTYFSKVVA